MIDVENLNVFYGVTHILRDVSFNIKKGELIALLGSNGAGKTTLVNTIIGMLKPASGSIIFEGEHIENMPPHEIVRRGIAQVPEGRKTFPYISVRDNLSLGAYSKEAWAKRDESIEWVYSLFPLLKERRNMQAGTLSGGEQQMLVIGRGLMSQPKLMMIDEPSLGLAPKLLSEVYNILGKLRDNKITVLLSEQNARQALSISDRGYVMENGRIVLTDSSDKLLDSELVKEAYLGR
jgi:branched-chain amino acid transport system ATP-binding protein